GYTASKHGVVGIMRSLMSWLAPHGIRINTIHPAGVATPMVTHEEMQAWFKGSPAGHTMGNALPVPMLDPIDISRAVTYLVEASARHGTGGTLPVGAGYVAKSPRSPPSGPCPPPADGAGPEPPGQHERQRDRAEVDQCSAAAPGRVECEVLSAPVD